VTKLKALQQAIKLPQLELPRRREEVAACGTAAVATLSIECGCRFSLDGAEWGAEDTFERRSTMAFVSRLSHLRKLVCCSES
jgi:hypothetical protein